MIRIPSQQRFRHKKQFEIIQQQKIGCGSFGTVKLARHRTTCRMYAIKIINLKDMPSQSQAKLIQRQIRLHSEMDHPQIIKLWDSIIEGDSIYMILQYAEQGNLFSYQNTKNTFTQLQAFKFFAQTLQGVKYLHQQNVIHRDLKPQNLLLDSTGNIKICDFGWCAQDTRAKRTTFCGTYQYMAPEMIFNSQYDYKVDIWALGVLLYEMLHGHAPFKGKSTNQVKEAMIRGSYQLGNHLSENVKELIKSILQFHPQRRLSLQQILQHPWFIETQNYLNTYLTIEKAVHPKQIQSKIGAAPPPPPATPILRNDAAKRRKNNSLNFEDGHNININLQINNYSIIGKRNKNKNNYHSQQKNRDIVEFSAFKEPQQFKQVHLKRNKMESVNRSNIQMNGIKMLQKIKSAKSSKVIKDLTSLDKKWPESNKKKGKLRRSQMQLHDKHQKYPVRFNTQANQEWCQGPKIKKSGANAKSKMMSSCKSALRLHKNAKD